MICQHCGRQIPRSEVANTKDSLGIMRPVCSRGERWGVRCAEVPFTVHVLTGPFPEFLPNGDGTATCLRAGIVGGTNERFEVGQVIPWRD